MVTAAALTLDGMKVQFNDGSLGGGLYAAANASVTIRNSTFDFNLASRGAAILNYGALTLVRSTIAANSAMTDGGQLDNFGSARVASCGPKREYEHSHVWRIPKPEPLLATIDRDEHVRICRRTPFLL